MHIPPAKTQMLRLGSSLLVTFCLLATAYLCWSLGCAQASSQVPLSRPWPFPDQLLVHWEQHLYAVHPETRERFQHGEWWRLELLLKYWIGVAAVATAGVFIWWWCVQSRPVQTLNRIVFIVAYMVAAGAVVYIGTYVLLAMSGLGVADPRTDELKGGQLVFLLVSAAAVTMLVLGLKRKLPGTKRDDK